MFSSVGANMADEADSTTGSSTTDGGPADNSVNAGQSTGSEVDSKYILTFVGVALAILAGLVSC